MNTKIKSFVIGQPKPHLFPPCAVANRWQKRMWRSTRLVKRHKDMCLMINVLAPLVNASTEFFTKDYHITQAVRGRPLSSRQQKSPTIAATQSGVSGTGTRYATGPHARSASQIIPPQISIATDGHKTLRSMVV